MKKIIFLCTGNSCRSQMAEGFAKDMLKNENHIVESAGFKPDVLSEIAVQVMKEEGVDISSQYSKKIDQIDLGSFDLVVTVCDKAKDFCPIIQHSKIINYSFDDPVLAVSTKSQKFRIYRKVRGQIKKMIKNLILNYDILCQEIN